MGTTWQLTPDCTGIRDGPVSNQQSDLADALAEIAHLRKKVEWLRCEVAQERQCANFDEVTRVPNRRLLRDRFDQARARALRSSKLLTVLFLDLDDFKGANDRLGHLAADEVLRQLAARLLACVRASDTVCRYGGDEFVVLLEEVENSSMAYQVVQKIRAALAAPYELATGPFRIDASIGVSAFPVDGTEYDQLIMRSDLNMYFDKNRNRKDASSSSIELAFVPASEQINPPS